MMNEVEFDNWNEVKKRINSIKKDINIKNGNIYLISIGQNIANENNGKEEFKKFLY